MLSEKTRVHLGRVRSCATQLPRRMPIAIDAIECVSIYSETPRPERLQQFVNAYLARILRCRITSLFVRRRADNRLGHRYTLPRLM
jgi:hypothetical protein